MDYKANYIKQNLRYNNTPQKKNSSEAIFDNFNNDKNKDENEIWLTTKRASAYLGITPNALRILVHKGKVEAFKLGSHLRFTHNALQELLMKKEY